MKPEKYFWGLKIFFIPKLLDFYFMSISKFSGSLNSDKKRFLLACLKYSLKIIKKYFSRHDIHM